MAAPFALTGHPASRRKVRHWALLALTTLAATAGVWLAGFGWFLWLAAEQTPPSSHADAIVVLTGGPERVDVALRLLAGGAADRLLVSGAGEKTDATVLVHLAGMDPAPLTQMITMGHAAQTTRGNALETASWAREQGVRTLLVVTTWFHMPRALVELRRVMPNLTLLPYPVGQPRADELVRGSAARLLVGEYHKYLAALSGLTASPWVLAVWGTEPIR